MSELCKAPVNRWLWLGAIACIAAVGCEESAQKPASETTRTSKAGETSAKLSSAKPKPGEKYPDCADGGPVPGIYEVTSYRWSSKSCDDAGLKTLKPQRTHFMSRCQQPGSKKLWVTLGCNGVDECHKFAAEFRKKGSASGAIGVGSWLYERVGTSGLKGATDRSGSFKDGKCTNSGRNETKVSLDGDKLRIEHREFEYEDYPAKEARECGSNSEARSTVKATCGALHVWEGKRVAELEN